jgi:hypothetical protein
MFSCALLTACATRPSEPAQVEDLGRSANVLEQRQQRTGAAYRRLEQTRYELKLAEQDWLNADEASRAAQKTADTLKQQADQAHQAFLAAQAKEAQARTDYEKAMQAVDELFGSGAANAKH